MAQHIEKRDLELAGQLLLPTFANGTMRVVNGVAVSNNDPDLSLGPFAVAGGAPLTTLTTFSPTAGDLNIASFADKLITFGARISGVEHVARDVLGCDDWTWCTRNTGAAWALVGAVHQRSGTMFDDTTPAGWATDVSLAVDGSGFILKANGGANATDWHIQVWYSIVAFS